MVKFITYWYRDVESCSAIADLSNGRAFYASEDEKAIFDYQMIYPCDTLDNFKGLLCTDGAIDIHNIVFQVERG